MKALLFILIPIFVLASSLEVNASLKQSFLNQHEHNCSIEGKAVLLVTWDRETTRLVNTFFDKNVTAQKRMAMLVDVSQVPSAIMSLFVLPRFRSHEHDILLSYDAAYNKKIAYVEGKVTVLHLNEGIIKKIAFAENEDDLVDFLQNLQEE